jgi:hypothetical protein
MLHNMAVYSNHTSYGLNYVSAIVQMIFSRTFPGLFTPGKVASTRRAPPDIDVKMTTPYVCASVTAGFGVAGPDPLQVGPDWQRVRLNLSLGTNATGGQLFVPWVSLGCTATLDYYYNEHVASTVHSSVSIRARTPIWNDSHQTGSISRVERAACGRAACGQGA